MGVGSEVMGEHLARAVAEKGWNQTSMVYTEFLWPLQRLLWEPPRKEGWGGAEDRVGVADVFACGDKTACQGSSPNRVGVEAASRQGYGQSRERLDVSPAHGGLGHPLPG